MPCLFDKLLAEVCASCSVEPFDCWRGKRADSTYRVEQQSRAILRPLTIARSHAFEEAVSVDESKVIRVLFREENAEQLRCNFLVTNSRPKVHADLAQWGPDLL